MWRKKAPPFARRGWSYELIEVASLLLGRLYMKTFLAPIACPAWESRSNVVMGFVATIGPPHRAGCGQGRPGVSTASGRSAYFPQWWGRSADPAPGRVRCQAGGIGRGMDARRPARQPVPSSHAQRIAHAAAFSISSSWLRRREKKAEPRVGLPTGAMHLRFG